MFTALSFFAKSHLIGFIIPYEFKISLPENCSCVNQSQHSFAILTAELCFNWLKDQQFSGGPICLSIGQEKYVKQMPCKVTHIQNSNAFLKFSRSVQIISRDLSRTKVNSFRDRDMWKCEKIRNTTNIYVGILIIVHCKYIQRELGHT